MKYIKIIILGLICLICHKNFGNHNVIIKDIYQEKSKTNNAIKDNKLENAIIYIVSGHGGPDPGTMAVIDGHTISEDEYSYDICLRLEKYIKQHNGTAYMIIKDETHGIRDDKYLPLDKSEKCYPNLTIPFDHKLRLRQRTEAINKLYKENKNAKYQIVIEIHVDSRSSSKKLDVFFYHCKNSSKGKRLAENIQKTFEEKYAKFQPNRGYNGSVSVHQKTLYVINNVIPPAILIELGNIQNANDQRRIINKDNREALAKWICDGIIKDFNNSKN